MASILPLYAHTSFNDKLAPSTSFETTGESKEAAQAKESVFPVIEKDDKERILKIIDKDGRLLVEREYVQTENNEYVIEKIYSYAPDGTLARALERKRQTIDGVHRKIAYDVREAEELTAEKKTVFKHELGFESLLKSIFDGDFMDESEEDEDDEAEDVERDEDAGEGEDVKKLPDKDEAVVPAQVRAQEAMNRLRAVNVSDRYARLIDAGASGAEAEKIKLKRSIHRATNKFIEKDTTEIEVLAFLEETITKMNKREIVQRVETLYRLDPEAAKQSVDDVAAILEYHGADFTELPYLKMKLLAMDGDNEAYDELSRHVDHSSALICYLARSIRFFRQEDNSVEGMLGLLVEGDVGMEDIYDFIKEYSGDTFNDHLIEYCRDPKNPVSCELIYLLIKINDPSVVEITRDMLTRTDDEIVLSACIFFLKNSDVREAKNDIMKFLDHDSLAGQRALEALAKFDAKEIIPYLLGKLDSAISGLQKKVESSGDPEEPGAGIPGEDDLSDELDLDDISVHKASLFYHDHIVDALGEMNVAEAAPRIRQLLDISKKLHFHGIAAAGIMKNLFMLEGEKALTGAIFPRLKELTSKESLHGWDMNEELDDSNDYQLITSVLSDFRNEDAYLEHSGIIIKELKLIATNQPSQKLLKRIDHTIQHLKAYSALHACKKEPEKIDIHVRDLVGHLDALHADPRVLKEEFDRNPVLVDRLIKMVLTYHPAQHEAMRLLAVSDKYVKKLFGQLKEPVVIEERKKMLFDAFLENNINSIVTNYTERYPHDGELITLKEKGVYFSDLDAASVIEFFARCGISLDEEQIIEMVSKNPYFRLTGGLFVPKLSLINSSYRGSREIEDIDAKYSTKSITVGLRYRGAEYARSTGLPMLYEWDLSTRATSSPKLKDRNVGLAFFFREAPPEHIRKRRVLVFDYFDFDIVKAMIRQQEKEKTLRRSLNIKTIEVQYEIDVRAALDIFGRDDSGADTVRGIIERLKTETGLLPDYVEHVYKSFDDIKDKVTELLESGDLQGAKDLLANCETIEILKSVGIVAIHTIEDRNISIADPEYDPKCYERELKAELDEVSKPSPVNIDEINASEALKGLSY
ncbi:HEAT repeat domain-containing protein [Candidatus Auribacterota bacterium]